MWLEKIVKISILFLTISFLGYQNNKNTAFKEFENLCYMEMGVNKNNDFRNFCQCVSKEKIKKEKIQEIENDQKRIKFLSKQLYDKILLNEKQTTKCMMEMGLR